MSLVRPYWEENTLKKFFRVPFAQKFFYITKIGKKLISQKKSHIIFFPGYLKNIQRNSFFFKL